MEESQRQTERPGQAGEELAASGGQLPKPRPERTAGDEVLHLEQELREARSELTRLTAELQDTRGRFNDIRARYHDLFDCAPVGYLALDREGTVLEANATLAVDLGLEGKAPLVGLPSRTLVDPADLPVFERFLAEICRAGKRRSCELRLQRGNASFWALLQGTGGAAADRFVCRISVLDITSCREAEAKVLEQRNLLRTIFRDMPGLHSIKDSQFAYQYVNPAVQQFLGRTEEEILGKTDFDLLPRQKASKYRKEDLEVIESGQPLVLDENVSTPLFGDKWLQITKIPVKGDDGRIAGIIASVNDITERKKMESELLKMQKLESVGVLAGGIAHDFNNLLTSILGNIELAKMYVGAEGKAFTRLVQAEKASLAAKNLTRQLLTFSRGGAPVTKTASLSGLIRDSTEFTLRGTNVATVFELPEDLWLAEIDEGQIGQVIQNLVKNADQAMPEGGVLEVGARNFRVIKRNGLPLKKGCYVEVTVRDSGGGISEKHLARVFDPYYTTKPQGSGLGLAVCYSIIKKHQGHIEVESQPGKGTLFRFYLPASQNAAPGKEAPEEKPLPGHGRLLVMDDDETVKEIAGEMLRHLGYEVEIASDGLEAIKAYIQARRLGKPFSAVLMDLTVRGGMGGREAARKLLELDQEAKVIAASGYATDPVMSDYGQYGFSSAVHKPFKLQELRAALRIALGEEQ